MDKFDSNYWALILGGSSGFGLATAKKLSTHGMNIFVVHRDRRGANDRIEKEFEAIRKTGVKFVAVNTNALTEVGRSEVLAQLRENLGKDGRIRVLMHSIAFGNLKPLVAASHESPADLAVARLSEKLNLSKDTIKAAVQSLCDEGIAPLYTLSEPTFGNVVMNEEGLQQTIYSMGSSLLTWVQECHEKGFFAHDARVLGMTSEGNQVAWKGYAAVAAAKVTLESLSRAIALEFAPFGIRSNIIQAGVTETPALKLIPGSERMKSAAKLRNPFKRTTQTEDVANFIALMCTDEAAWVNGTIIRVDGGEQVASF